MRTRLITILMVAGVILISAPVRCLAGDEQVESIWSEDRPRHGGDWGKWFELTDEGVAHFMGKIAEDDPNRAGELEKLRESEPEKFKAELRDAMRERFRGQWKKYKAGKRHKYAGKRYDEGQKQPCGPYAGKHEKMKKRRVKGMLGRYDEKVKWLEENYPEEAEKLAQLREKSPERFQERVHRGLRRYWRIAEAEEDNPELAGVLKEDLALKQQRDELLGKIAAADEDDKGQLSEQLEEIVSKRYDIILRRKQIEYDDMFKRLARMKAHVEENEAKLEQWKDADYKSRNIKVRVEELVGKKEKFRWY